MEHLVKKGFKVVEVIDSPHNPKYLAWKFEETQELVDAMREYQEEQRVQLQEEEEIDFKTLCEFVSEEAKKGILYTIRDFAQNESTNNCSFRINKKKHIIIRVKKSGK